MTLPNSGRLGLSNIQSEFGGGNPANISEYYRGGRYVPNASTNNSIPTGGKIDISDFYGTSNIITNTFSAGYSHSTQRENDYRGYTSLYTYTAGTSKINEISWDPYYEYNAGHWNGNVSQYLQVRNTANTVIWSYTLNGLNPPRTVFTSDRTKAYRVKENGVEEAISGYVHAPALGTLNPNTRYSIWQAAQTRTGPPYGVMSARGNIQSSFQFIPQ